MLCKWNLSFLRHLFLTCQNLIESLQIHEQYAFRRVLPGPAVPKTSLPCSFQNQIFPLHPRSRWPLKDTVNKPIFKSGLRTHEIVSVQILCDLICGLSRKHRIHLDKIVPNAHDLCCLNFNILRLSLSSSHRLCSALRCRSASSWWGTEPPFNVGNRNLRWIIIRELGSASRFPLDPAERMNEAIEAASPRLIVMTSLLMSCMASKMARPAMTDPPGELM